MMKFKSDIWTPPSLCSLFGIDDIALAVGGSALLSGAASLFGGSSQAAGADQAAYNSNAQYLQSRSDQTPWRVAGGNAVGQINALLGLGGTQGGVGGGGVSAPQNAFATPLVGQLYANQSSRGQTPTQDIAAALALGRTITPAQWAQGGFGPNGEGYFQNTQGQGSQQPGAPGISAQDAQTNAFAAFRSDPGYQWSVDQGSKALQNSAAARGILNSGATAKALTTYGQGLADQQYGNYFSRLQSLAGLGQTSAAQTGQLGLQSAGQSGNALMAAGGARASAYGGVAQSANQGIGNYLFSNMYGNGGGGTNWGSGSTPSWFGG